VERLPLAKTVMKTDAWFILRGNTSHVLPHIDIVLLIEHYGGEGNQKIPQAQEVKSIKKSEAE